MNPINNTSVIRNLIGHSAQIRTHTDGRLLLLDTELPESVESTTSPCLHRYSTGEVVVVHNHDLADVVRYAELKIEGPDQISLILTSSYPATKRLPWPCELPKRATPKR